MKGLILVGYRCTGKTTAGRMLARRLGMPFADTDEIIEERTGKTAAQLVPEGGWPLFREKEREALEAVTSQGPLVLATGGGIVESEMNRKNLKRMGLVVWLTASPGEIERRMLEDPGTSRGRPPLSGSGRRAEIEKTLARREQFYSATADLVIDTADRTVESVVEEILHEIKIKGKGSCLETASGKSSS